MEAQSKVLANLVKEYGLADLLRELADSITTVIDESGANGPKALTAREEFNNTIADDLSELAMEVEYFVA